MFGPGSGGFDRYVREGDRLLRTVVVRAGCWASWSVAIGECLSLGSVWNIARS